MTHDEWMTRHRELDAQLRELVAKRDELDAHSEYVPGPVLVKRRRELDEKHGAVLDALNELVELDGAGHVR